VAQSLNLEVRVISEDVRYADGAEQELIDILESTQDRSSQSDELFEAIHDWPTLYHLSPLRAHLLSPLKVGRGDRVLEVGCGTGVNVRVMAEQGAHVVGIEGTYARATAARIRNAEFDNVEILAGDFADFETGELFDVVLVIGVLEYTPSGLASIAAPLEFLQRCRTFLKDDGVIVLAIENQLGLKYLLSYPEDHVGVPWIGLEGYRKGTPRTWSRLALSQMLDEAGLAHQEFLNPFPDYKLPNVVIRDRLYRSAAGRELVKNFIRRPVVDHSGAPQYVCDGQLAFAEMVDAGLGPEVPNSFLVVASSSGSAIARRLDDADAWIVSDQRRSKFRRLRRILSDGGGNYRLYSSLDIGGEPRKARSGWLTNRGHDDTEVFRGVPLDDVMVQSILNHDRAALTAHLELYRKFLDARAVATSERAAQPANPFGALGGEQALPGTMLDCVPQNLIVSPNGELVLVDLEWEADGDCSLELVFLRGLLGLAARLTDGGFSPLFLDRICVSRIDVLRELARVAGRYVDNDSVERLVAAEYELQSLVAVSSIGSLESYRAGIVSPARRSSKAVPRLRLLRIAEERDHALSLVADLRVDRASVDEDRQRISADRDRIAADRDRVVGELGVVLADRQLLNQKCDQLADAASHLQREIETVRLSSAYRIGRVITWPVRAPRAALQRVFK